MFDSLDEQLKENDKAEASPKERMMKYLFIGTVSVVLVGGIFAAIQFAR
jgi:hypothetical protein